MVFVLSFKQEGTSVPQKWFSYLTCSPTDEDRGCCVGCARVCGLALACFSVFFLLVSSTRAAGLMRSKEEEKNGGDRELRKLRREEDR